jgi:putative SOS response-associated peptidase YedK
MALMALLQPYPAEQMEAYPVSSAVNRVSNDGPAVLEPASAG